MAKNAEPRMANTSIVSNHPALSSNAILAGDDGAAPRAEAIIARIVTTNSAPAMIVIRKNGPGDLFEFGLGCGVGCGVGAEWFIL